MPPLLVWHVLQACVYIYFPVKACWSVTTHPGIWPDLSKAVSTAHALNLLLLASTDISEVLKLCSEFSACVLILMFFIKIKTVDFIIFRYVTNLQI